MPDCRSVLAALPLMSLVSPILPVVDAHAQTGVAEKPSSPKLPPHRHPHAEWILVRTATIEVVSGAPLFRITAGGADCCAPGKLHGFRNVGRGLAEYFPFEFGPKPVYRK